MGRGRQGGVQATGSALDRLIQRFQHRWETDPRWRSAMSAALALVALVTLCVTVFGVADAAAGVLTGLGIVSSPQSQGGGTSNTGAQLLNGSTTFPTPTVSLAAGTVPPISTIANSQTPVPVPTSAVTPTTVATATSTGGGGGGPTTCAWSGGGDSTALAPCPLIHGQSGTLTITTSPHYAGAQLNILLSLGSCTDSCTYDWPPGTYALNSQGDIVITYAVPHDANVNATPISGMVNVAGGPTLTIQGPPVQ